jgi:hypothetical protein
MKLNKYIYKKLEESFEMNEFDWIGKRSTVVTEEDIDDWIADWYNDTFINIRDESKPRGPPMWLCGPRWYDRRKRMIKEAEARSLLEQERCGIDEG